jgi:hypothetical protein
LYTISIILLLYSACGPDFFNRAAGALKKSDITAWGQ